MKLHSFTRRTLCKTGLLLAALPLPLFAQDGKPIEWAVGYAAGGGSDIVARSVAEPMSKSLNRTLVIVNKPGAATNIAAAYVARTKDPTNTMLTADFATLAANPSLFATLPYDPEKDFMPVGMLARFPLLVVLAPDVPAKDWKEFAAWVRSKPEGVNYASAGIGSPHHLAGELLREQTGLKMIHTPYRGAAPAVQDLLGSQVPFGIMDTATVAQHVESGKLRAIGVASPQRLKGMNSIPTLAEQGVAGYEAYAWQGLVVPAGNKPQWVAQLNKALVAALESPAVKERMQSLALEPLPGTPEQMTSYVKAERERWGKLIKANGIKLD